MKWLTHPRTAQVAMAAGVVLFAGAAYNTDFEPILAEPWRVIGACGAAIVIAGVWHLVRTWMWAICFVAAPPFTRLARVRIAAEAFSYLTIRGVAGEPLKYVLLGGERPAAETIASIAFEKFAYIIGTALLAAAASAIVIASLSLSPGWVTMFKVVAIVAAITTVVILAWLRRSPRDGIRAPSFALAAGTVAAFFCMVAEVWAVLRISGVHVTWTEAVAIETFSRVASFVSAFVPGNLGVLEMSTLSATAAVGLSSGAAPLAVARRLRGLFWAAIGLVLYPRTGASTRAGGADRPAHRDRTLLYVASTDGLSRSSLERVAGLPIAERVVRAARRAGFDDIVLFGGAHIAAELASLQPAPCRIRTASSAQALLAALTRYRDDHAVTIVGEAALPSVSLLERSRSIDAGPAVVDVPAGDRWPYTGVFRASIASVREWHRILPRIAPKVAAIAEYPSAIDVLDGRAHFAATTRTAHDRASAGALLQQTAHKSTDATVARFNRRISLPISIALLRTPITANQFSIMLIALGLWSAWLFSLGHYAAFVAGAAVSLAASILDGCDGEIARLKYQDSALGCWIETVGDYTYYIAILVGMTIGVTRQTGWSVMFILGNAAMFGTLLSFAALVYLRRTITEGSPDKLHAVARKRFQLRSSIWSRVIWRVSFVATRAAMPYGILALALVNALPVAIVLWAIGANVYWMSLALKFRDLVVGDEHDTREIATSLRP